MPETSKNELPRELPAEVAALGKPVQTFAPGAGSQPNPLNLVATVANSICALLLFGMALFFFRMYHKPFGVKPPPPGVSLGVALGCAALGFGFVVGAVWYGGRAFGAVQRSYLLFDDFLVELLPDRHRILPWAKIGRCRRSHPWVNDYSFPVDGDDPVRFDEKMTGHAELARAISQAALVPGATAGLIPGASLDSLRTGVPAPYFLALRISWWSGSFLYRVSPVGNSLLFLKVFEGGYSDTPNAVGGGLAGSIGFVLAYKNYLKMKAILEKLESADPHELLRVSEDYEGSFAIANADVRAVRIVPLTSWQRFWGVKHGGRLELDRAADGQISLTLETAVDAQKAAAELSKLFPERANVKLS
jgi:hypothetical protein